MNFVSTHAYFISFNLKNDTLICLSFFIVVLTYSLFLDIINSHYLDVVNLFLGLALRAMFVIF